MADIEDQQPEPVDDPEDEIPIAPPDEGDILAGGKLGHADS